MNRLRTSRPPLVGPSRRLGRTSIARSILRLAVLALFGGAVSAQEPPAQSESVKAFEGCRATYDQGKWDEAIACFRRFETNFEFSKLRAQAIFFEGWCHYNQKKFETAAETFGRVREKFPDEDVAPAATLKQAEALRELKTFDKSLGVYREFQRRWPEHQLTPQSILGESWTLYKRWQEARDKDKTKGDPRDLARAKELALLVREQHKTNFAARMDSLFLLGTLYNAEEAFDKARAVYEEIRSMRNNPRATEALFLAAEALYDAKRYDDAITYYGRVKSKEALLEEVRVQIATLRSELPRHPENRDRVNVQIRELSNLGSQIQGQQNLRPLALFRTANCFQELSRPDEACIVYRHFLRLYPDDKLAKQAHFGLTQALTAAGRPAEAEAELKKFKERGGDDKDDFARSAMFLDAKAKFDTGQYDKAKIGFNEVLQAAKDLRLKETCEFYLAACEYGLEKFEAARDAFARFLKDHPASALAGDSLFRLARVHFELSQRAKEPKEREGNLTKAAEQFEEYRKKHKTAELLPDAVFQLGYLYGYLGEFATNNYSKAISTFQEFLQTWPDRKTANNTPLAPEASYQIGIAQMALDQTDAAVATLKDVIAKFADSPIACQAAFDIGRAYAIAKKSDQLVAALHSYVEKCPDHSQVPRALYAMGEDLLTRGKTEEAFVEYRKLIALTAAMAEPTDDQLGDALRAQMRITGTLEAAEKVDQAIEAWTAFLEQYKKWPTAAREAVNQIARLYSTAGRLDEAYLKLDALATTYNTVAAIRVGAISSILELALPKKNYERAYAAALRLQLDPEKDKLPNPTYLAIAKTYYLTERFPEARKAYDVALKQCGGDPRTMPTALAGSAQTFLKLNQPDKAAADATTMLKEFPNHPASIDANLVLAKVYFAKAPTQTGEDQKKTYKEMVTLADFVFQKGTGAVKAEAAMILGTYFLKLDGDCKTALPYFLQITFLTGGPLAEEAAFRIAECQECLIPKITTPEQAAQQRAVACRSYQDYLKRFPAGRFVAEARPKSNALCAAAPAK